MKSYETILTERIGRVEWVILNRADVHNALNSDLINDLYTAFDKLRNSDATLIVLTGNGASFCAGADLMWMKSIVKYSFEQNLQESRKLEALLSLIFNHPLPVIAKVNGSAFGGGVGLLSACDITIGTAKAKFCFTEVKLGLSPAVISPFVINRIGLNKTTELFLSADMLGADEAKSIGLLNYIESEENFDLFFERKLEKILRNGPEAIKKTKDLIRKNIYLSGTELTDYTTNLISSLRISEEGQEGMNSFFEKRDPNWIRK